MQTTTTGHERPLPRSIRRAVNTLAALPPEALSMLAEAIINRLDAGEPDVDLEAENEGSCEVEDWPHPNALPGDSEDSEDNQDDEGWYECDQDGPPVTGPAWCGEVRL